VLNDTANVLEYEDAQNLLGYGDKHQAISGRPWFNEFVHKTQFSDIKDVFIQLFDPKVKSAPWRTYQHHVIRNDGSLATVNFANHIIEKNGQRYIESFGFDVEDMTFLNFKFPEE